MALTAFSWGCNMFEAIDNSVNSTSASDLISEGRNRLAESDYATALDRFDRAMGKEASDDARRGRASAYAGLAGFNMFKVLNSLQNEVVAPNSSASVFQAAKQITNLENLNSAIEDMALLNEPSNEDLLFRGLISALSAAKTIIVKYDTNLNSVLDTPDQVNFTTNDKNTKSWQELYSVFSSTSSPYSIEKAYIDLTLAFDGRGISWTTLSPFNSIQKTGKYTQANANSIEAVGNFGELIKEANLKYGNSVAEFKTAILNFDGANQ